MKKRILVIAGIICIGIILAVIVRSWLQKKDDWYNSVEGYGPLNVMELDKSAFTNNTDMTYPLDSVMDFQIKGQFTISKGEVEIIASLNGELLFMKTLNSEVQTFESDIYTDRTGEIKVDMIISDDIQGDYSVVIYTRETNLNRLIRRMKG